MAKIKVKSVILLALFVIAAAISVTFTLRFNALAFWEGENSASSSQEAFVKIGVWDTDGESYDFDNVYEEIRRADSLILSGERAIHILGSSGDSRTPIAPVNPNPGDVLLWQNNGRVTAVQISGALPNTDIYLTWDALETAVGDSGIPLSKGGKNYTAGNVYNVSHVPVKYRGKDYLVKRNGVTSTPSIGDDWFLISESYIEQDYPAGCFTVHNGLRYYKISAANAEPGTDVAVWQEVPEYVSDEIEQYSASKNYSANDIVSYLGSYYIALSASVGETPGTSAVWYKVEKYDPNIKVPLYSDEANNLSAYGQGAFVKTQDGGDDEYYLKTVTGWDPAIGDGSGGWVKVSDYNKLTGVQKWSASTLYDNAFTGKLVEYDGMIFQRRANGWVAAGTAPSAAPQAWEHILTWEEAQSPPEFLPGSHPGDKFFKLTAPDNTVRYFVTVLPTWDTLNERPDTPNARYYREVLEWSDAETYTVYSANDPWNSLTRKYHAYTVDPETGVKTFWTRVGAGGGNSGGEPTEGNDAWRQTKMAETTVVTTIGGNKVVWDKNTAAFAADPDRAPQAPSLLNNDWIRRVTSVSDEYVYTVEGGNVLLWQNITAGGTEQSPGSGADWQLVNYKTGISYVYTANSAGVISIWYSALQTSEYPGSGDWQQIYPLSVAQRGIVYIEGATGVSYYDILLDGSMFELLPAWMLNSGAVLNNFSADNLYTVGDIVIAGETALGEYRYFELIGNPSAAKGIFPSSSTGAVYWRPVNTF